MVVIELNNRIECTLIIILSSRLVLNELPSGCRSILEQLPLRCRFSTVAVPLRSRPSSVSRAPPKGL